MAEAVTISLQAAGVSEIKSALRSVSDALVKMERDAVRVVSAGARERVRTSGRRWEKNGFWRTVFLMWTLRLRYFFGADPAQLARIYRRGE